MKLKESLAAHRTVITLVTAAIVFATFWAKDYYRDHYKESADATRSAETFYTIRSDILSITKDIQMQSTSIGQLTQQVSSEARHSHLIIYDQISDYFMEADRDVISWNERQVAITEFLFGRLSEKPASIEHDLAVVKDDLAAERSKYARLDDLIGKVSFRQLLLSKNQDSNIRLPQELRTRLSELADETRPISAKVSALTERVLEESRQQTEKSERTSKEAALVHYSLTALGFFLTVVSQWLGIKGESAGEE